MTTQNTVLPEKAAFALRLAAGVIFGLAMAWLAHTVSQNTPTVLTVQGAWRQAVYSTLLLSAFVWWAGAGTLRRWSLAFWGAIATVGVFCLAWHQAQVNFTSALYAFFAPAAWLILPLLFIAHELVSSGDRAGRLIAPYATYFDQAWKHGVQLLLSLLFTGLFWVILLLGAELLHFIGFDWLRDWTEKDWVFLPVTGAAMACAVQLGDVQDKLLVNVRTLVLSVLSWLLPVIAAMGLLFVGSLCASGLEPLWKTKAATASLLAASFAFVLLINAAYQQGDGERPVHVIMKGAARLACLLLLVFAGLATYSLWLRIDQYGLTVERVLAGAGAAIALLFGLGYVTAAVWPGRWLAPLQGVNIAVAFVKVVIFLGLLTPLADPERLSVDDQMARIHSGRTPERKIDWYQLRFSSGRYGMDALRALAKSGRSALVRQRAVDMQTDEVTRPPVTPSDDMSLLKVVYPKGAALPANFNGGVLDVAPGELRDCVRDERENCVAAVADLNGDGVPDVAVMDSGNVTLFTFDGKVWRAVPLDQPELDKDDIKAFEDGKVTIEPHAWSDLKIGKTTLTVNGNP